MNKILEKQINTSLAKVFKEFKNEKEVLTFLEDFLTQEELETLSKRLAVAYWLKKGRSQENITENLNVTTKTISDVKKMIKNKNFQKGVNALVADEWANQWATKIKKVLK